MSPTRVHRQRTMTYKRNNNAEEMLTLYMNAGNHCNRNMLSIQCRILSNT